MQQIVSVAPSAGVLDRMETELALDRLKESGKISPFNDFLLVLGLSEFSF